MNDAPMMKFTTQSLMPGHALPRHRHPSAYIALVLSGRYLEAGDAGRRWVGAGAVALHGAFDAHANWVPLSGARVLNLPLTHVEATTGFGSVPDPDAIARLGESDPEAASEMILRTVTMFNCQLLDWPDDLALHLRTQEDDSMRAWAHRRRLSPSTVSRGFQRAFGLSPQRYRLEARTQAALRRLATTRDALTTIATDSGFADQAHMNRSVRALTGFTPREWRARSTAFKKSEGGCVSVG
jgi:AraC-like DNA-binding protein